MRCRRRFVRRTWLESRLAPVTCCKPLVSSCSSEAPWSSYPGASQTSGEHQPTQIYARRTADTGYRKGRLLERIKGQMIFVAEDEPLVSLDIADALRAAGA